MLSAIAGLLMLLSVAEKHEAGLAACAEIVDDFGYHGCITELNEDEARMWFHLLCFEWDPIKERGAYNQAAVIAYRWNDGMLSKVSAPYLIGCPEYS